MDENKLQNEIDAGQRVENFLNDEAVIAAFERLKQKIYGEFLSAKDPVKVQAKASALDEIQAELRGTVGNGKTAADAVQRREKARKR